MLQGGGGTSVWKWLYIFRWKLVMVDVFVHIYQYRKNFITTCWAEQEVSELNESCILVNKCLFFILYFWFPWVFSPPFSFLHCSWGHLGYLKSMDRGFVEWDSHASSVICVPWGNCSCEGIEAEIVSSSFAQLVNLFSSSLYAVFWPLNSTTSAPLLDPLFSLSFLSPLIFWCFSDGWVLWIV